MKLNLDKNKREILYTGLSVTTIFGITGIISLAIYFGTIDSTTISNIRLEAKDLHEKIISFANEDTLLDGAIVEYDSTIGLKLDRCNDRRLKKLVEKVTDRKDHFIVNNFNKDEVLEEHVAHRKATINFYGSYDEVDGFTTYVAFSYCTGVADLKFTQYMDIKTGDVIEDFDESKYQKLPGYDDSKDAKLAYIKLGDYPIGSKVETYHINNAYKFYSIPSFSTTGLKRDLTPTYWIDNEKENTARAEIIKSSDANDIKDNVLILRAKEAGTVKINISLKGYDDIIGFETVSFDI